MRVGRVGKIENVLKRYGKLNGEKWRREAKLWICRMGFGKMSGLRRNIPRKR